MSELLNAIRERIADRKVDATDLDHFLEIASQGGVSAAEARQILEAVDSTEHGMTPELRARMLVRLQRYRASDAIGLVNARPVRWNDVQRLTELRARVALLIEEAKRAKQSLHYNDYNLDRVFNPQALEEGRFERNPGIGPREAGKLQRELTEQQQAAVRATENLREELGRLSVDERQIAFAGLSSRWEWNNLSEAVKPRLLTGMSEEDKARLAAPFPADGLTNAPEGSASFAGLAFDGAVQWTWGNNDVLQLPEGARIRSFPIAGDFQLEGKNIALPGGQVLQEGRLRVKDGVVTVVNGAVVRAEGVPLRSRNDAARVRGSNNSIVAGPGLDIALPILDARGRNPNAPPPPPPAPGPDGQPAPAPAPQPEPERNLSRRTLRYSLQESSLPDGVELRRGSGRMTVLFDGDRAVGVLDGSSRRDLGAMTYRRVPSGQNEVAINDTAGERGKLTGGAAVYRDDTLIGFMPGTRATIDELELSVEGWGGTEMAAYRRTGADSFELGKNATVSAVPAGRTLRLTGEGFKTSLGNVTIEVISGGVLVENGVVTQVLPGSRVRSPVGTITTQRNAAPVRLLTERPATMPDGNAVFMDRESLSATGRGFTVEAGTANGILAGGKDEIYSSRDVRNAVVLNGGSVRLRPHSGEHMKPAGLEAYDIRGDVTLQTGPQSFNTRTRQSQADRPGVGGPMMWAQLGDQRYEIDARPMWSSADPATDTGRTILLQRIQSQRFAAHAASVESILAGKLRLSQDNASVQPELTRSIQETLSYYLDRRLDPTGTFDGPTEEAVKTFQRMMLLEPTGAIDAQTMHMLDEIAPRPGQPTITRTEGRFGPPVEGLAAAIINGQAEPLRYRGRGQPTTSGELVARVQQTLNEQGLAVGNDAMFGPGMETAVRTFQTRNSLPVTGQVDAATMRKLVELSGSSTYTQVQPRPKYMVMIYVNDSVPDELRRFRELAALRGATPIIIGPPGSEMTNPQDVTRFFARAERGEIDFDWLVPSGHSTGSSTWGPHGRFEYSDLQRWSKQFPRAFAQIEMLSLLNCYNVTPEKARDYWPSLFPNLKAAVGFMYAAPGKETQASDEFLLNSGVMLAQIKKGEPMSAEQAREVAGRFERDEVIRFQNAGIWLRTPEGREGHYGLTATARREMNKKGAMESLRTIPAELTQAYQSFMKAESDEFAEPPSGMNSQLRDYLGAVQHALDTWEGRITRLRRHNEQRERQLAPHRARREQDPSYQIPDIPIPEEFQSAYSWESSFKEMQGLRARILSLIKSHNIRDQFGAFYGRNIEAFNAWLTDQATQAGKQVVLFPRPSELSAMNRRQMLQRLEQVQQSLAQFDHQKRSERIMREEWSMIRGRDPSERTMASPDRFMERARAFLVDLNPDFIQPEWLDDGLLAADLRRNQHVVVEEPATPPERYGYGGGME